MNNPAQRVTSWGSKGQMRANSKYKPPPRGGGLYSEGRFNGGFSALRFWGAYIWRGLFSEFYGDLSYRTCVILLRNYFFENLLVELLDYLNEERKPELNLCIFEKPQKFHCVLSGELPVDFGSSQVNVNKGQCIIALCLYSPLLNNIYY